MSRALAVWFVLVARVAAADAIAAAPDEPPTDVVARPLVLDRGQLAAYVTAEIELQPLYLGAPFSLAPDVWYGVSPRLTLGIIHSDPSVDRIGAGASFCVNTQRELCPRDYHGSGVDGLYSVIAGNFSVAAHARFLIRELDPIEPAVTLGAEVRWQRGRWSIDGDPYLQLGLAHLPSGNRAELWLPIVLAVQPTRRWAVELHTGWNSDLAVIRDGYDVPAAVGTRARATGHLDVGAEFGFTSILGPQNDVKARVLLIDVGWRT